MGNQNESVLLSTQKNLWFCFFLRLRLFRFGLFIWIFSLIRKTSSDIRYGECVKLLHSPSIHKRQWMANYFQAYFVYYFNRITSNCLTMKLCDDMKNKELNNQNTTNFRENNMSSTILCFFPDCKKCIDQLPCQTCIMGARSSSKPLCRCPFCYTLNFAHYNDTLFHQAKQCENCHKYFAPDEALPSET